MSLASIVHSAALWAAGAGPPGIVARLLLNGIRRGLVAAGDPLLPYRIGNVTIAVPLSHDMPFYRRQFPLYDTALSRLAAAVWAARPGSCAIDIGANIGDTAAAIRTASPAPILAIEGNPRYGALLRSNAARIGNVTVEQTLVAATAGSVSGVWRLERGTGRVVPGDSLIAAEQLADIGARHPELPPPALVKIDTDGFDCPIIEANAELWARWRPVLFFEYAPDYYGTDWSPFPMFEALLAAGYERALVYDQYGEYFASVPLTERTLLGELRTFYSGRYADLCLWHREDRAAGEAFRRGEETVARLVRPRFGVS